MITKPLRGVVHGNVIELNADAGMVDGEEVEVILRPMSQRLPPGEGLRRTEGALADDTEWDEIMEEIQQGRRQERRCK
jgi:hypothetical protein